MATYYTRPPAPGLRLLGQDWVDHGYPVSRDDAMGMPDCPFCGAGGTNCTAQDHQKIEQEKPNG